jgi:hypothetical protein
MCGRPTSWLGLGPVARSSRGSGPRHGNGVHTPGALTARSTHAVRACDSTVAHSLIAWWWLANGKVLSAHGGHREGTGQGDRGRSSPERRCDVEAVENSRDGDRAPVAGGDGGTALQC